MQPIPYSHPIRKLQRPTQRFRFLHQKLLIALVEESVASRARSIICSNFENKCHELGARLGDIQLFRTHDYNIQFINETWFGEHKLKEKSEVERKKWAQIRPALRELVLNFESEINNVSSNVYIEDRLRDRVVDVDWLFVSAQMLIRGDRNVSPAACKRLWNNVLSPTILLPYRWTHQDFFKLKVLTVKQGKRDFYKVAKEMGYGFTPFLCMKLFVRYIRPLVEKRYDETNELRSLWSREEVQEDFRSTMEMYNGSIRCTSLWMSHAYDIEFPDEFLIQQVEKYRIGQFSLNEDCLLLVTDEIIREHNLDEDYTYADFLTWRPEGAWNHRIFALRFPHRATSGGKHHWSEDEDRHLIKWAKKRGIGWTEISKHFTNPRRSRKSIQARYMILLYKLRKQSLEEFHAKHRETLNTPFYYMRKSLCFLEEIEVERCGGVLISPPDPEAIRNLFQRSHASCNKKYSVSLKPSHYTKQYPQHRHMQGLLLEIPSFYLQQVIKKIRAFLTEIGIDPTLPP